MYFRLGRRSLGAIGGIFLVVGAPAAHATNFKISSTRIDPKVGGLSGTIHDTYKNGRHTQTLTQSVEVGRLELKGTSDGQSVVIDSYCADIFDTLGTGTFSSASLTTLDLSSTKLTQLSTFLENADALVSNASSSTRSTYSAAAQLGVWEILNETGSRYDVTSGSFYVSGSELTSSSWHQSSATQVANTWLGDVTNNVWKPVPGSQLSVITALHNQTQIFVTHHASSPPPDSSVPEPASWTTMIAGFGLIGAAMRRQRLAKLARS